MGHLDEMVCWNEICTGMNVLTELRYIIAELTNQWSCACQLLASLTLHPFPQSFYILHAHSTSLPCVPFRNPLPNTAFTRTFLAFLSCTSITRTFNCPFHAFLLVASSTHKDTRSAHFFRTLLPYTPTVCILMPRNAHSFRAHLLRALFTSLLLSPLLHANYALPFCTSISRSISVTPFMHLLWALHFLLFPLVSSAFILSYAIFSYRIPSNSFFWTPRSWSYLSGPFRMIF